MIFGEHNKKFLEEIFGNREASDLDIKKVYNLFNETKSIQYAKNTSLDYSIKAKKALDVLNNSDAKHILIGLAEYSIRREK